MSMPIVELLTGSKIYYLAGAFLLLLLIYFCNRALGKKIFKWSFALILVGAAGLVAHSFIKDDVSPSHENVQAREKDQPLVKPTYYKDPLTRMQDQPEKERGR
jgi:hypothetical protein